MHPFTTDYIRYLEDSDEYDELSSLAEGEPCYTVEEWRADPPEQPRKPLFTGLNFFVTASDNQVTLDSVGCEAMGPPFNKNELKATLEEHGGTVVPSIGVESESGKNDIFLISNNYARTMKFLYCLAGGIPCVSDDWITKCIEYKQLLDWTMFQLDSGYSLEEETVIEPHNRKPLIAKEIFIAEDLCNEWERVLIAAGAIPFSCDITKNLHLVYTEPANAFVFVTNAISQFHKNQLSAKGIPVVKPEWIAQSLITGEVANFVGHPDYCFPTEETVDGDSAQST